MEASLIGLITGKAGYYSKSYTTERLYGNGQDLEILSVNLNLLWVLMKNAALVLTVILMSFHVTVFAKETLTTKFDNIKNAVVEDHRRFYSCKNLLKLGIGIGAAGTFATSSADEEIQDWFQKSLKNHNTDKISDIVDPLGDYLMTLPVLCAVALMGELTIETKFNTTVGAWAKRSLRAVLVGEPSMYFSQRALGASRPNEGDSHWHPFEDENGVSGHSFIAAIPFITAAMMVENPYCKSFLYAGSTLTGLARINDNKHYFSHVSLGWWMAYLAARSVQMSEERKAIIVPTAFHDFVGVIITFNF